MERAIEFLLEHGYMVIFLFVFAEQIGLPLPAMPVLLAAGALAGTARMDLLSIILVSFGASLLSDLIWFYIGRSRGNRVLAFLCKLSLEPDHCVKRTETIFGKYGDRSLLFAKFIPGLNTMAPPLAGIIRLSLPRFILFDGIGTLLWAGSFITIGYIFSDQLEQVMRYSERLGRSLVAVIVGGLAVYIGWRYYRRQQVIRALAVARITPHELKEKIDNGEDLFIVDLRHELDIRAQPLTIPGATQITPEELDEKSATIPRDRDIILYCS